MQTIDQYKSDLGTAILIVGGAGSGKTSLGLSLFPKTYVFAADPNLRSGLDYLKRIGKLNNVVGFDTANPDENGVPVPPMRRYARLLEKTTAAIKDPNVETIFHDSASFIEDIIKAKICNAATEEAIRLSGFEQWGALQLTWKSIVTQLRQSGKRYILAAHETKEKDESDQIFKYRIAVDGAIAAKLPAMFSDVWRTEVVENNGKHEWKLRTLSNVRQEHLKNSFNLPAVLLQSEVGKLIS